MPPPFRNPGRCRSCGARLGNSATCLTCGATRLKEGYRPTHDAIPPSTEAPAAEPEPSPLAQPNLPPWGEPTPVHGYGLSCPRCEIALRPLTVAGVNIHACDKCGGLAMSHLDETRAMAPQVRLPLQRFDENRAATRGHREPDPVAYLKCPSCARYMARRNFERVSGVIVDRCLAHGVWFDVGELARALAFLDDGGEERRGKFEARERAYLDEHRRQMRDSEPDY